MRTIEGIIDKIIEREEANILLRHNLRETEITISRFFISKENIIKHSKYLIDLIEVGDYVNGEKVFSIEKDPFVKGQTDIFFNRDEVNYWGDRSLSQITDKDIKSIVTKEQFKSIEYIVED